MRRVGIGGLACAGLLALVVGVPQPQSLRPARIAAPAEGVGGLGVVWTRTGALLARVDPATLRARPGRMLRIGFAYAWATAPAGGMLAVASHFTANVSATDSLRFVELSRRRWSGRAVPLDGSARAVHWTSPDRVVVLVSNCCEPGTWVAAVDPGARRVVARTELEGSVVAFARSADALILLMAPQRAIGPSRLVVVEESGNVRSVPLEVDAGTAWPEQSTSDPIGTQRIPALVAEPGGGRAYVVTQEGLVADVDLASLAVAYHRLSAPRSLFARLDNWLEPAARAKGVNGTALNARWLGNGLIAVAGSVQTARVDASGTFHGGVRPWGVEIVDTRTWSVRVLDAHASALIPANGLLLTTGSTWDGDGRRQTGSGLTAYAPDWSPRFTLFRGKAVSVVAVTATQAFVSVAGESRLRVVQLRTGRVVGVRGNNLPMPLLPAWPGGY